MLRRWYDYDYWYFAVAYRFFAFSRLRHILRLRRRHYFISIFAMPPLTLLIITLMLRCQRYVIDIDIYAAAADDAAAIRISITHALTNEDTLSA